MMVTMKRFLIVCGLIFVLAIFGYIVWSDISGKSIVSLWRTFTTDRTLRAQMPSLDRRIENRDPLLAPFADSVVQETQKLITSLRIDWKNFDLWIQLGLNFKMLNDFEGARDAWEFAAKLKSDDALPFRNLGNLYGYELHDIVRAEENFVQALTYGKDQPELYYNAHEFYRDVKKDRIQARKILEEGIFNNPLQAENLRIALEAL